MATVCSLQRVSQSLRQTYLVEVTNDLGIGLDAEGWLMEAEKTVQLEC